MPNPDYGKSLADGLGSRRPRDITPEIAEWLLAIRTAESVPKLRALVNGSRASLALLKAHARCTACGDQLMADERHVCEAGNA